MLQMAQYNWIWMGSQPSNLVEKIKEFTRFVSNVVNSFPPMALCKLRSINSRIETCIFPYVK